MNLKRIIVLILFTTFIAGLAVFYIFYNKIYKGNVKEDTFLYIPSDTNFDALTDLIEPHLNNTDTFVWVAEQKNYPNTIKAGKYDLNKGMNNNALVNLLRSGKQTPVKVSFNNQDTVEKLAGRIAEQIEADSVAIVQAIKDPAFLNEHNLTRANVLGLFVPNSYEFFWNTSAEKFRDRFIREFNSFWNETRSAKAKKLNLSKHEVITLASIVQKETSQVSERPTVAWLYLNRIRQGWPLGADPTIIYLLKQKYGQDTVIKRVLTKDLAIESPYNTYLNRGLPPSLIAMPDISSIDAVLNDQRHDYFYMCASVTNLGYHEFAKTLAQHNRNAAKYHRWVSEQGINR